MEKPLIKLYSYTIDCPDPKQSADFYAALLSWEVMFVDDEYAAVAPPGSKQGSYPGILFQKNDDYRRPVWPEEGEAQQQMAHLDLAVTDVEKAVEFALQCGASVANQQFSDQWRVMLDPAGHPFCLCMMKSIIESEDFALL